MSTFKFTTGNRYIDGRIVYSHKRNVNNYEVTYSVQMRRNNSYTGVHTHGRISYKVYLNDTSIKSATNQRYDVYNGGAWYTLVSGTYTVSLGADKSTNYSIGFSASTIDGISAFNVSYQKTPIDNTNKISTSTTPVGKGTVQITDSGKNTFTITSKAGGNGSVNNVTGCILFFTTNGKDPIKGSEGVSLGVKSITRQCLAGETITISEGPINADTVVKAFNSTMGKKIVNGTNATDSDIVSESITYYAPPVWPSSESVRLNCYTPEGVLTTNPNPNSNYEVSWDSAIQVNDDSPLIGYRYMIYKNSIPVLEKWVDSTVKGFTFSGISGYNHTISISDGDSIAVTVTPYTYWGNGTKLLGDTITKPKNGIQAKFAGIMTMLDTDGNWKSGQAWVKTPQGWRASEKVFIKTPSGWEESI